MSPGPHSAPAGLCTDPELHGDEVGVGVHAVHPLVEAMHHVAVVVQPQDGHVWKGTLSASQDRIIRNIRKR